MQGDSVYIVFACGEWWLIGMQKEVNKILGQVQKQNLVQSSSFSKLGHPADHFLLPTLPRQHLSLRNLDYYFQNKGLFSLGEDIRSNKERDNEGEEANGRLLPYALWLSASTLKFTQFDFALIINPSSMGKQAQKDSKGSASHVHNGPVHDGDSSSFSVEGNCRAQRRTARRRLTKLVHTICFLTTAPDGSLQPLFCQLTADSALRSPQALRALALRQVEQHAGRMGVRAVKELGKDEEVKVEERLEESGGNVFMSGGVLAVGQGCFHW